MNPERTVWKTLKALGVGIGFTGVLVFVRGCCPALLAVFGAYTLVVDVSGGSGDTRLV